MKRHSLTRALAAFAILAITAIALAACGSSDSSSTGSGGSSGTGEAETGSSGGGEGGKLGLLMDVARNDKSFGQATYEGAKEAADELGLELNVVDNLEGDAQKAQSALLNFAKEEDYVINGALPLMGGLPRVAAQYPDTEFSAYSVAVETSDNLHYAIQDFYPLGYLAGVAAAETTKTDTLGFVGGGEIPATIAAQGGFEAAAEKLDPGVKILSTITGDFEDTTKAKDAAAAQIAQGADIIYAFLDAGHLGAVEAAKEAGDVKVMGVVVPKCEFSQGLDIGDTVSYQGQLTGELVRGMAEGDLENTIYGVQDPKVATFKFCPGGSPAVEKAVEAARKEFVDGTLTTPDDLKSEEGGEE